MYFKNKIRFFFDDAEVRWCYLNIEICSTVFKLIDLI